MKTTTLNYEEPQVVEITSTSYGILCSSTQSSTEDVDDLEDFFGLTM